MDLIGPLDELAATLAATDAIRSASTDPAEIIAPGVLVQLAGVDLDHLDAYTLSVRLLLVVSDNGLHRSVAALSSLLGAVVDVIDPAGTATPVQVTLPASPAPMPGLSVPVALSVTY